MDSDLNEALSLYGKPEIFNSNLGSQYRSYIYTQPLKDDNITISMDRKGKSSIEKKVEKVEKIILNFIIIEELMKLYNIRKRMKSIII